MSRLICKSTRMIEISIPLGLLYFDSKLMNGFSNETNYLWIKIYLDQYIDFKIKRENNTQIPIHVLNKNGPHPNSHSHQVNKQTALKINNDRKSIHKM